VVANINMHRSELLHVWLKPNDAIKRLHVDTKNGNFEGRKMGRWIKKRGGKR
jgi:hypothetical protein